MTEQDAFAGVVEEIKDLKAADSFDYESAAGNRAARSYVHALRGKKGDIDRVRKAAKAHILERGRAIDTRAKLLVARIDTLIEPHAAAIRAIEVREETRIAGIRERLDLISYLSLPTKPDGEPFILASLQAALSAVKETALDDTWQEFLAEAGQAKDLAIAELERHIAAAQKRESEAAELERLRLEAEQRAEQKAAAERAELELKLAAERAESARLAEKEAAERTAREAREAQEARERSNSHRAKVMDEAAASLAAIDINPVTAERIIAHIVAGNVPHVTLTF